MGTQRVWMALPYAVLLALAAWFYKLAAGITYSHQGDNLGPDFWPRVALAAMMVICTVQVARLLLIGRADSHSLIDDDLDDEDLAPRSNLLLLSGLVVTIAYGALVTTLGFLISTFAFMVLFMYAGRYRGHASIWLSSFLGTLILTLLFQRVVYVSLPRGVPPFDHAADLIFSLF